MNWQKRISIILLGGLLAVPVYTEAQRVPVFTSNIGGVDISCSIYSDQASLGHLHTGDTYKKMYSILGEPSSIYRPDNMSMKCYYNGLIVNLVDWNDDGNYYINTLETVYGNNRVATLDGVRVGDSENTIMKVYGSPDSVITTKAESPKLTEEQQKKFRKKYSQTVYTYNANKTTYMTLTVKNGVITKIFIHHSE